jgi:3-hydroxymyristoyl/3-hydroxydecanoyl-(acyl carrier protein) dehydratase
MVHEGEAGTSGTERLPHRFPFQFIDRIVAIEPGRWAVGVKQLGRVDLFLDDAGWLPRVLLIEAMAQVAGLAAAPADATAHIGTLACVDRFRCRAVASGESLVVTARVVRRFGANVITRASVHVAGRPCAAAELVLHLA